MLLIGNKIDLTRDVTKDEGKLVAEQYKIPFFETSAKNDEGIDDSIRRILTDILIDMQPAQENIKLNSQQETKGGCSC